MSHKHAEIVLLHTPAQRLSACALDCAWRKAPASEKQLKMMRLKGFSASLLEDVHLATAAARQVAGDAVGTLGVDAGSSPDALNATSAEDELDKKLTKGTASDVLTLFAIQERLGERQPHISTGLATRAQLRYLSSLAGSLEAHAFKVSEASPMLAHKNATEQLLCEVQKLRAQDDWSTLEFSEASRLIGGLLALKESIRLQRDVA
eukprot:353182-Chlamydomonas_euryale.AAC.16